MANSSDAIDWGSDLNEESLSPRSPVISLPDSEKKTISNALAATHWERAKDARLLGIGRTTSYRKLKEYGFDSRERCQFLTSAAAIISDLCCVPQAQPG